MPERKQIKWAQLRVGILVLVSLIVFAVAIFFISGQTGFFTRRYTLKAYFSDAGGVRDGAEVQLAGIPAGNVSAIRISPFTDPARAVEIDLKITRRLRDQIRSDSVATIATAGLLGEGYVEISRGTPAAPIVPNGGVLQSHEEADIKKIVQNTNDVISNLRVLSSTLNDITNQIQAGKGTIGKLIYDPSLYNRINDTTVSMQQMVNKINGGQGTLGKLFTDDTVYNQLTATVNHLNQVVEEIQHGNGTAAKFISDPTVYNDVHHLVTQANTLMDKVNSGQGSLGKFVNDPQLYTRLNDTMAHVDTISARIDEGQGTLGKLSTDPTLFNNLNESSKSLRDFLTEFRKNPRKFLTLHMKLF